jgi:hypothetical protein
MIERKIFFDITIETGEGRQRVLLDLPYDCNESTDGLLKAIRLSPEIYRADYLGVWNGVADTSHFQFAGDVTPRGIIEAAQVAVI